MKSNQSKMHENLDFGSFLVILNAIKSRRDLEK